MPPPLGGSLLGGNVGREGAKADEARVNSRTSCPLPSLAPLCFFSCHPPTPFRCPSTTTSGDSMRGILPPAASAPQRAPKSLPLPLSPPSLARDCIVENLCRRASVFFSLSVCSLFFFFRSDVAATLYAQPPKLLAGRPGRRLSLSLPHLSSSRRRDELKRVPPPPPSKNPNRCLPSFFIFSSSAIFTSRPPPGFAPSAKHKQQSAAL